MYKHILVPVDGSETSRLALKQAFELAKEQSATIRLIYVGDEIPPYAHADAPVCGADHGKLVRDAGERLLAHYQGEMKDAGVVFDTKYISLDSSTNRACDVINKEADHWPADLIVIGTHGRRGPNRSLLGSVAETVIRTANKPVLVVHGDYRGDADATLPGS